MSVSYSPDVFGLNKRTVESLAAQEQATRYQMIAVDITLSANVAEAAITEASLEDQIATTNELIGIDRQILSLLQYQKSKGYIGGADVAAQQTQLGQLEASLPPLVKQRDQQKDLLAVLTGGYPAQAAGDKLTLASLSLPADLPLSLPSLLVEQRPDILQAEENMHSASAEIGVATRKPAAQHHAERKRGHQRIVDRPDLRPRHRLLEHRCRAPRADLRRRHQASRGARCPRRLHADGGAISRHLLIAFQNVADTLVALQQDANTLKATAAAADSAKTSLDLARLQYKDGYAAYLGVLNADQAYQQARLAEVQAEADRFSDTAALFQALGGGWWHRPELLAAANAQ